MSTASAMAMDLPPSAFEGSTNAELLNALCANAARLGAVELENNEGNPARAAEAASELCKTLESTLEILAALEQMNQPPESDLDGFGEFEPDTRVSVRSVKISPPKLEDVCFAGSLELSRALRALNGAKNLEAQLVATETAHRKLGRAIFAVIQVARDSGITDFVGGSQLLRRADGELASALVVRRLYSEFRRTLRRAENESAEAVLTALRYAAGAVAILTASPHYAVMRVSDRALLRRQRDRLLEWSRAGKPVREGLQLLEDIWTCADLLRDINRRQELRAHDTTMIRELLRDSASDRPGWLDDLAHLAGLDDALDALTVQIQGARTAAERNALSMDIVVRLSFLV